MSGPLALFQNTIPANRDVTRNALGGPGATTKLEGAPPRFVGGDCGWAGRAGEPLLGGYWVHRPRRRYAAGDGGQINKLWERRAAAAAPNRSGFPMPAPLAIPCASIAAAYRKKSVQRNLQQISR